MASFASSATTSGARKHDWTNRFTTMYKGFTTVHSFLNSAGLSPKGLTIKGHKDNVTNYTASDTGGFNLFPNVKLSKQRMK